MADGSTTRAANSWLASVLLTQAGRLNGRMGTCQWWISGISQKTGVGIMPLKQPNSEDRTSNRKEKISFSEGAENSKRLQQCSAKPCFKQKEVLEWQYPQLDRSLCALLACEPECNQMKNKVTLFTVAQQAGPWIINHILIIHGCLRQICAIIVGRTPAGGLRGMKYEICFPQGARRLKEL